MTAFCAGNLPSGCVQGANREDVQFALQFVLIVLIAVDHITKATLYVFMQAGAGYLAMQGTLQAWQQQRKLLALVKLAHFACFQGCFNQDVLN